jgi:hypothetical protein
MASWLVGYHQRGGICYHSFFLRTPKCERSFQERNCKKMGDCHAKVIQFSYCQQHLDIGATSQK